MGTVRCGLRAVGLNRSNGGGIVLLSGTLILWGGLGPMVAEEKPPYKVCVEAVGSRRSSDNLFVVICSVVRIPSI